MPAGHHSQFALYRRLLLQARPYWLHLFAGLILSLLSTPISLLTPLPMKLAVDSVIGSQPVPVFLQSLAPHATLGSAKTLLLFVAGLLLVITLFRQLQGLLTWMLCAYTGEKLLQDFRARLFRHVQRLSLAYHDSKGTADSTYRIQYDANCIQSVTLSGVLPLITSTVTLFGMIYVIARMDWQLALVALAVSPVLFGLSR